MRSFQGTYETCKRSFINAFLICTTAPLSTSEKQAAIKIIEKDKGKQLIEN